MKPGGRTLRDTFRDSVQRFPFAPALGTRDDAAFTWLSYKELSELVSVFEARLSDLGVRAGDRVVLQCENSAEWVALAYACFGVGAVLVPLYARQRVEETANILATCSPRLVLARPARVAELKSQATVPASIAWQPVLPSGPLRERLGPAAEIPAARATTTLNAEEPCAILYTSGTSGTPRGVVLSHANVVRNIQAIDARFSLEQGLTALSILPWANSFGFTAELHNLLAHGCAIAICNDPTRLMRDLGEVNPDLLFAVPRIYSAVYARTAEALLARGEAPARAFERAVALGGRLGAGEPLDASELSFLQQTRENLLVGARAAFGARLRWACSGGAALSKNVGGFLFALGFHAFEGYGLTETGPVVAINAPDGFKLGTVGKPLPGVEVRCGDQTPNGEIYVRGPSVIGSYYGDAIATRALANAEGWFATGDKGSLDEDGYLVLEGRLADRYKLDNGVFVWPEVVEQRLLSLGLFDHAIVFGANRPYNVALLKLRDATLASWKAAGTCDGLEDPRLEPLVSRAIQAGSQGLSSQLQLQGFVVTSVDLSIENGLLTPTLKPKRAGIHARFRAELDALFDEAAVRAVPGPPGALPTSQLA